MCVCVWCINIIFWVWVRVSLFGIWRDSNNGKWFLASLLSFYFCQKFYLYFYEQNFFSVFLLLSFIFACFIHILVCKNVLYDMSFYLTIHLAFFCILSILFCKKTENSLKPVIIFAFYESHKIFISYYEIECEIKIIMLFLTTHIHLNHISKSMENW